MDNAQRIHPQEINQSDTAVFIAPDTVQNLYSQKPGYGGEFQYNQPTYTAGHTRIDMQNNQKPWIPGPTGFEPKELVPPRFELKELKENMMILDYAEQENCIGIASKVTRTYGHRFWGEFFAFFMPIFDFVIAFILELFGFVLRIPMHLLLGTLVRISDYVFKPILAVLFNAFTIPSLTHANSCLAAVIRMLQPVIGLIDTLVNIGAIPLKAFRLVEYNKNKVVSKPYDV